MHRLYVLLALVTVSCTGNDLLVLAAPQPYLERRQSGGGNGGQDNNPATMQRQIWVRGLHLLFSLVCNI